MRWKTQQEATSLEKLPCCTPKIWRVQEPFSLFVWSIIQLAGRELTVGILKIPYHALSSYTWRNEAQQNEVTVSEVTPVWGTLPHSGLLIPRPRSFWKGAFVSETSNLWKQTARDYSIWWLRVVSAIANSLASISKLMMQSCICLMEDVKTSPISQNKSHVEKASFFAYLRKACQRNQY